MQDLLAALCLVLILEGILPFIHPEGWRAAVMRLADLEPRTIRAAGGIAMLVGLLLLNVVRG